MNTELRAQIINAIKTKSLASFSCYDFLDLSSYKTISKCLERMEDEGFLVRIIPGIYCLYEFDSLLNIKIYPSVDNIVHTIARKHKWSICPSGNTALNLMGISTQVVAAYEYLSNGPYKEYEILGSKVFLKRTMNRDIVGLSYKSMLLVQCIKAIGKDSISDNEIDKLSRKLSPEDKKAALEETQLTSVWIRNVVVDICRR